MVVLRLSYAQNTSCTQPLCCPNCGFEGIKPWGHTRRSVLDIEPISVSAFRFVCPVCQKTFRTYPKGFDRSTCSLRIRRLAGLIWLLDLSIRDVANVFREQGVQLNRMTIWREGMKLTEELNRLNLLDPNRKISLDRGGNIEQCHRNGVVLVLNLGQDRYSVIGTLNCNNPKTAVKWLTPFLRDIDVQFDILDTKEFSSLGI